jgi:hypothetical protein
MFCIFFVKPNGSVSFVKLLVDVLVVIYGFCLLGVD